VGAPKGRAFRRAAPTPSPDLDFTVRTWVECLSRMAHPKDRPGLSRAQLLKRAGIGAAGIGGVSLLAGCQNTTVPIGACADETGLALVEAKPVGPGGLPLPRTDNSVTWAITEDNPSIAAGLKAETGALRVFNYADYIDPATVKKFEKQAGAKVQIATYNSADEALAKLSAGAVRFDVIIGLSGSHIVSLIAKQLLQPLNHTYLPHLENIWPELREPFYDRGGHYTVPYTVWQDGIGWRNDKLGTDIATMDVPYDIFWESQSYRGKVAILDDKRDALSMPMQREGMHDGVRRNVNTEDPELVAQAGRDLEELTDICNVKYAITDYQTLPEAKTWLHQSWSGDLLGGAFYNMPKNVKPDVLSFWAPDKDGVVQNDFLCIGRAARSPVLAHQFLNFMLDERNAFDNFVNFNGYTPPQNAIDADTLIKQGLIPKSLIGAVVRPDQFATGQELLQLTVTGERAWDQAWSKFKAG
jgi:spermidine/putrescine transport system substrate-binding protein